MKVLVTGSTAPLGAAIVQQLLADPAVELVLAVGREPEATARDAHLVYRGVDLTRSREVHDLIDGVAREHAIDTVVHAAQHRDPHDRGPRVHAQNVEATRALVLACAGHSTIRRFVYRSFAEVYAQHHGTTSLLDEDAALEFDPRVPQWVRDRVEADLTVCAQHGPLEVVVLRCAELFSRDVGSQLWDYLASRICLRPIGFDPMVNVISLEDAAAAFGAAVRSTAVGVFNIPGADTLPLRSAIDASDRIDLPVPNVMMAPLYELRRVLAGFDFRYDLNVRRFHFGGVLDGGRAHRELGYSPRTHVRWPET